MSDHETALHEIALRVCAELFQQIMDGLTIEGASPQIEAMRSLALKGGDCCSDALWRQKLPGKDPIKELLPLARDIKRSADDTPSTVRAQQQTLVAKGVKLAELVLALPQEKT